MTTYNPNDPRPNWTAPRKLEVGMKVVVKLGPEHRQYDRLESFAKGKYLKGVIDWISPKDGAAVMEIRINRVSVTWLKGGYKDGKDFFIRVEHGRVDCYNFMDAIVIRRV